MHRHPLLIQFRSLNPCIAHNLLAATFTQEERDHLFAHPEFGHALERSSDSMADIRQLNQLGVRLLLARPTSETSAG